MVHLKIASDYLQGAVTCCRYIIWLFCCLFVRNMAIALDFGQLISSGIYIHIWILTKTKKRNCNRISNWREKRIIARYLKTSISTTEIIFFAKGNNASAKFLKP